MIYHVGKYIKWPAHAVDFRQSGRAQELRAGNPDPIWLVYPPTRHLTPKVRALVDFMTAQFNSARPSRADNE
jgi:DNA-binding transcriptional LysR family regulator